MGAAFQTGGGMNEVLRKAVGALPPPANYEKPNILTKAGIHMPTPQIPPQVPPPGLTNPTPSPVDQKNTAMPMPAPTPIKATSGPREDRALLASKNSQLLGG